MAFITSFGLANPDHCIPQSVIAEFMVAAMQMDEEEARKLRALYRASGIVSRYSVLGDYARTKNFEFYSNTPDLEPFPTTGRRMELYREHAVNLSEQSAKRCLEQRAGVHATDVTHLIVVSCTGMYAPGLDIDLLGRLGIRTDVKRTCINFMGCYAAFNALKLANSFCQSDNNARVLIVCTELCSIHFQREKTEDNILANALFADGSAAMLVERNPGKGVNLQPESFYCDVAVNGDKDMAWTIGDAGFEMKLSSYVPEVIRDGIRALTMKLLSGNDTQLEDVAYYAVHPGGRRILEVIEEQLGMTRQQNAHAYEVLKQYGNMSSATVVYVLARIWKELNVRHTNGKVLSFAFGPGLTMESMLLSVVNV